MTLPGHAELGELPAAILAALAESPAGTEVPVTRLTKRLGLGASVMLRQLASMGDAPIGGVAGPGWVRVTQKSGRWICVLTDSGRLRISG